MLVIGKMRPSVTERVVASKWHLSSFSSFIQLSSSHLSIPLNELPERLIQAIYSQFISNTRNIHCFGKHYVWSEHTEEPVRNGAYCALGNAHGLLGVQL